jgi:hypothetical protein
MATTVNEELVGKYIKSLEWIDKRKLTPQAYDYTCDELSQNWESWDEFVNAAVKIHNAVSTFPSSSQDLIRQQLHP